MRARAAALKIRAKIGLTLISAALVCVSMHTGLGAEDVTSPQLVSIDFTPKSVDVSSAASTITVTAHLTDNNAGVDVVDVHFISWSGQSKR
jgi:hypothetical protein